ncbi:MAG TPA: response regulator transcription factor [Mycobacteriales bacterium]|nr:response regulator transcription factor [Mycobacteriales bacterium]
MTRVLVVDDSEFLRGGLTAVLETAGMTVVGQCASGAGVLDAFRSGTPDVVLMDVSMPGVDGVEATRRLLAEAPAARVLILTLTASAARGALAAGASGCLLKDGDGQELVAAVRAAAGRYDRGM